MGHHRSKTRGIFIHLPKRKVGMSKMTELGIVMLVSSLGFALVGTILAIYINSFVGSDAVVGLVSGFLLFVSFLSYLFITPIIEKTNKARLFITSSLVAVLGYILFSVVNNFVVFVMLASILTISTTIRVTSFGIIVRHTSKKKELAKNEGLIYTLINLSWVLGPLLAGFIMSWIGLRPIFVFAAGFLLIGILIFKASRIDYKERRKEIDRHPFRNLAEFFKNKDLRKIYFLSSGVNFWWSLIYIYAPLFIIKSLGEASVGYFLFAAAMPLVFFEYFFGRLAGKIGFKKVFFPGFLIPAIFALVCFIYPSFWVVLTCLILANIGLSMTESTTEACFFDMVKGKQDQKFYSTYNTAIDTGQITGSLVPALFLLFLPFNFIFLVYAAGMLFLALLSLRMRNIVENKKK